MRTLLKVKDNELFIDQAVPNWRQWFSSKGQPALMPQAASPQTKPMPPSAMPMPDHSMAVLPPTSEEPASEEPTSSASQSQPPLPAPPSSVQPKPDWDMPPHHLACVFDFIDALRGIIAEQPVNYDDFVQRDFGSIVPIVSTSECHELTYRNKQCAVPALCAHIRSTSLRRSQIGGVASLSLKPRRHQLLHKHRPSGGSPTTKQR